MRLAGYLSLHIQRALVELKNAKCPYIFVSWFIGSCDVQILQCTNWL